MGKKRRHLIARGDRLLVALDDQAAFRTLSSRYIAEEMRTGKYPPKQAVAIGLSRTRREMGLQ